MQNPPSSLPPKFPIEAHLVFQGEAIPAYIKHISIGGASILTARPVSATVQVVLTLPGPSGSQVNLTSTTVYSFESEPDVFQTGLRFRPLSEEDHRFVIALMLRKGLRQ